MENACVVEYYLKIIALMMWGWNFLTDEEVSEWLDEESLDDLELSLAAEEAESTA